MLRYFIESSNQPDRAMSDDEAQEARRSRKRKDPPSPNTSDDEEQVATDEPARLDWRMDPGESHSDWTITILVNGTEHATYHTHKNYLSVGAHKSEYFARLLQNQECKEHETQTSRITFENELAAKAFPVMLDFVYMLWKEVDDDGHEGPITTENCTALYYLGAYFEIRRLRKKARQFRNKEIGPDSLGTYFEHARAFHDESTTRLVMRKLCATKLDIGQDSYEKILKEGSDAKFWLNVLQMNDGESNRSLSEWISRFLFIKWQENEQQIDLETFHRLTDVSVMPIFGGASAMEFLEIEQSLLPASNDAKKLSNLQDRCVEALASDWDFVEESGKESFEKLNPMVLSSLLLRTVEKAKVATSSSVPMSVTLSGAGISEVNGLYTRVKRSQLNASVRFQYSMSATYQGRRVSFLLSLLYSKWYIYINQGEFEIDINFYCNDAVNPLQLFNPPNSGWSEWGAGILPAPTIKAHYDK